MKALDQGSSLFWLSFSVAVFLESIRLDIGSLNNPGVGFLAFGSSGLLAILSLILFFRASFAKKKVPHTPFFPGSLWKRVPLVLIALLIYSRFMPDVGYLISTFLLMIFLFWIVRGQKWWWVVGSAFLTTVTSYLVFSVWLNCQFPSGVLGL